MEKKLILSVLVVLCGVGVILLFFYQNYISGEHIARIIEKGDIGQIMIEKWQVIDSELILTSSNEYDSNDNELVNDISQLKLKNIRTRPLYNTHKSNERYNIQFLKDGNICGTIEIHGDGFFMFDWNYRDKESVHYRCMMENSSEFLEKLKKIYLSINDQIPKIAQSYPTSSKTSSKATPFFIA